MAGNPLITRTTMTDDDGTGTTGTVINNAWKTSVYDQIDAMLGSSATAWTSYTPTLTNITIGNGTSAFKWYRLGKVIHVEGLITFGSTTSVSGSTSFSLPASNTGITSGQLVGRVVYIDNSPANFYGGPVLISSSTVVALFTDGTPLGQMTSTVPFTWTTSDKLFVALCYQEA